MSIQQQNSPSFLDSYPVGLVRRNHGLEHATLQVLAQRHPRLALAGHSDLGGFWIVGNVPTDEVRSAADEALQRLRNGERQLAVHPNCGTNLITAGALTGSAAVFALSGAGPRRRDKLERWPLAIALSTIALIISQPLGLLLQKRVTTSGEPRGLQILSVKSSPRGRVQAHRVSTRDDS